MDKSIGSALLMALLIVAAFVAGYFTCRHEFVVAAHKVMAKNAKKARRSPRKRKVREGCSLIGFHDGVPNELEEE